MAISTGNIRMDALNDLQVHVENGETIQLTFPNLCFIFAKKFKLEDATTPTDFQDMCDYLDALPWIADTSMTLYVNWYNQTVFITAEPATVPSTMHSSG